MVEVAKAVETVEVVEVVGVVEIVAIREQQTLYQKAKETKNQPPSPVSLPQPSLDINIVVSLLVL